MPHFLFDFLKYKNEADFPLFLALQEHQKAKEFFQSDKMLSGISNVRKENSTKNQKIFLNKNSYTVMTIEHVTLL